MEAAREVDADVANQVVVYYGDDPVPERVQSIGERVEDPYGYAFDAWHILDLNIILRHASCTEGINQTALKVINFMMAWSLPANITTIASGLYSVAYDSTLAYDVALYSGGYVLFSHSLAHIMSLYGVRQHKKRMEAERQRIKV